MELSVHVKNVEVGDATLESSDTVSGILKGVVVEELKSERLMVTHPGEEAGLHGCIPPFCLMVTVA